MDEEGQEEFENIRDDEDESGGKESEAPIGVTQE